jgi:HEAT repeat protein
VTRKHYINTISLGLLLLACARSPAQPAPKAKDARFTTAQVVTMLSASTDTTWREKYKLVEAGRECFPIYDRLLADEKTSGLHRSRIYQVLDLIKDDRSRYVLPAKKDLVNLHSGVRSAAARLLGKIGTERDCSPLVALLFDDSDTVLVSAAESLAQIGGPDEVLAIDAFLRSAAVRGWHPEFLAHISKQRDELRARLARKSNP